MKLIGIIGGMSWESTATYYQEINKLVSEKLGGLHSARILLHSVDFADIERLQVKNDWQQAAETLGAVGRNLAKAGARILIIATNTMHIVAPEVQTAAGIPLIHIADATGKSLVNSGVHKAGLIGTRITMEGDFYTKRLSEGFGVEAIIPPDRERQEIHRIIYEELCKGIIRDESRRIYLEIINKLVERGAEGIVLGCTEIPLLVRREDVTVSLFDTTRIHAQAAVEAALK